MHGQPSPRRSSGSTPSGPGAPRAAPCGWPCTRRTSRRGTSCGRLVVEHDDHALRRVVLFEAHQHAREHVERAGRHALARRQPDLFALAARDVHQAVVGAEDVAVSVDDVEALRHAAQASMPLQQRQDARHAPHRRRRDGRRSRPRRGRARRGRGVAVADVRRDHPRRRRRGARARCCRGCATTARASASTTHRRSSRWTRSPPRRSPPSPRPRSRSPPISSRAAKAMRWSRPATPARSVLACARRWTLLQGVRRAALAAVYPTELRRGEKDDPFSLILDVGATIDATAEDLVGFAVMGSAYAKLVSQNRRPRVALLSNGTEAGKGPRVGGRGARRAWSRPPSSTSSATSRASTSRAASPTSSSRSGFVGNVVLKMLEGVSETVVRLARYAHKERLAWRLGLVALSSAIDQLKEVTDWQQYGGAPLLGFTHPFIKAHGRSQRARDRRTRSRSRTRRSPETSAATSRARWPSSTSARSDDAVLAGPCDARGLLGKSTAAARARSASGSACSSPRSCRCRPVRARRATRSAGTSTRRTCAPSSTRSRDLAKRAIETAADKQAYPGATALLRALRQDGHRICIVSGSPTQMRQVLAAKLALDGVEYDEFVLKNNLQEHPHGPVPRAARADPLQAAGDAARRGSAAAADARDAVRRRRRGRRDHLLPVRRPRRRPRRRSQDLERVLDRVARLRRRRRSAASTLARGVPEGRAGRRACSSTSIAARRRSGFRRFGPRLVPVFNYFQAALVLYEDKVLSARQVIFVALEMLDSGQYELGHLATSVQDVIRRGRITRETALQLTAEANEAATSGALSGRTRPAAVRADRRGVSRASPRAWHPPPRPSSPSRAARLRPPRRRGARASPSPPPPRAWAETRYGRRRTDSLRRCESVTRPARGSRPGR